MQICCCRCDPRLATYAVSIISFLHFGAQTILVISEDEDHPFVAEEDGIKFYTVLLTHLFITVSSLFLFIAAFKLQIVLCLPWLLGCAFCLLLYSAVLVLILIRIVNGGGLVNLETALFLTFLMAALIYGIWIVAMFTMEVKAHTYDDEDNAEAAGAGGGGGAQGNNPKPKFTLYDEEEDHHGESDSEEDLVMKQKSDRSLKDKKKSKSNDRTPLILHSRP